MPSLSIIVPVYNSQLSLNALAARIEQALTGNDFELILVNDGSKDQSLEVCRELAALKPWIHVISFYRNFGQIAAIYAGLGHASKDVCIVMDDDLQNPPESIQQLTAPIEQGYDFVFAIPERPAQSRFRQFGSRLTFLLSELFFDKPKGIYPSSFIAVRTDVAKHVVAYKGPFPYFAGHLFRITHNGINVIVPYSKRQHGRSHYNLRKLIRLWLNGIANNSVVPLRMASLLGLFCSGLGLLSVCILIIAKIFINDFQTGWPSLMATIITFSGVQLLSLGILGEYIGRVFSLLNNTPQYAIREHFHHCSALQNDSEQPASRIPSPHFSVAATASTVRIKNER